MKISILAAVIGYGLLAGAASAAESGAPATTVVKPDKAAIEARSRECHKEAEVRGLHNKDRRKFIDKCKRGEN